MKSIPGMFESFGEFMFLLLCWVAALAIVLTFSTIAGKILIWVFS